MPAMGDVDEFIKVARPDGRVDESGLRTLDEPCIDQSDTAVLNLRLRQSSKHVGSQPVEVASVSDPSKSHQRIAAWMKSIEEIHKHRRTGGIGGLGDGTGAGGADIEGMMSEWPNEEIAVKMRNAANKIGGCDALSIGEVARWVPFTNRSRGREPASCPPVLLERFLTTKLAEHLIPTYPHLPPSYTLSHVPSPLPSPSRARCLAGLYVG